ncbi:tRNA threonylcarbamoyladenosine biosynthesis protein TsaB [Carboxydocella sporoproducens DSM 16521]|uniref:tRNA threonylcarbamoyladenosine biosynthesis protein TsaB n=2 Tax=Carboxydocella TaxID=178898 RepID=A0A1T4RYB5_9FIRM|nr:MULTISPECIES: tRNA (adenosine(37)-N6)-threonylcarbamoyltransferase complex dimerization subunit type 1 TsaB [Carboxydocella]AVX21401.1 tRNA threonylcarbamoyladenosine biosynthesis protein TsaB [Carboxydocella thermautotrophica]SKA20925.1 tRNA threonylcarbamoyladenosine biosynthesis protein TsaB [Carboxydocella sporoproducens DSM 16521]
MVLLAIDTATRVAGVALRNEERLLLEKFVNLRLTHSQTLLPAIDQLLREAELTPRQLTALAVTHGPGSFTGLRIGLATVRTLAQVLAIPVLPVSTLDVLAANYWGGQGWVCPLLDARKNQTYTALYRLTGGEPVRQTPYQALTLEELVEQLDATEGMIYLVGDGVAVFGRELQAKLGERVVLTPEPQRWPRAAWLAELAWQRLQAGEGLEWSRVEPMYLRQSEAEETWARRQGGRDRENVASTANDPGRC